MRIQIALVLGAFLLLLGLLPTKAQAQSSIACTHDVIVVVGDTLIDLANTYLGDPLVYPNIIAATNAAAAVDDSYATIDNAGRIMVGWRLCIPPAPGFPLTMPTPSATPPPTTSETTTESSSMTLWSTDSHPLQIEVMRQQSYPGSLITFEQTLEPGANYSRYIVSYLSDGLRVYALMTVPNGQKPATGWPVIVFNHGYITPAQYRTTERYVAYVDALARNGYIVFKSDYRGHGNSEGDPVTGGGYGMPGYTVDVLNAVASLKAYADADPNRIGAWGHSMGGQLALRAMVVSSDIKAGVIWGGVVAPYPDIIEQWNHIPWGAVRDNSENMAQHWGSSFNSWVQDFSNLYGAPSQNPDYWATISPNSYLADLSGPIALHHSSTDEMVPVAWSEILAEELEAVDTVPFELHIYPGDNHNINANFNIAMQRTLAFFDANLKGQ